MTDTVNRPRLVIYHANATNTGSAARFQLHPARDSKDGSIHVLLAKQLTVGGGSTNLPMFPTFDWDCGIEVKLGFADVCALLQVFRGECESVNDGKGLYHRSAMYSTRIVFRHVVEPMNAYSFEVYRTYRDGGVDESAHIMFTSAEALGLGCLLESSMAAMCFGCGCGGKEF